MIEDLKTVIINHINTLSVEWFIGVLVGLFILCLVLFLFILKLLMTKGQQDQTVKNLKEKVIKLDKKVSTAESNIASLDSQLDSLQKQSDSLLRIVISQKNQSE